MRLTVNTTEPLEEVLRVVGAMYGVQLTVVPSQRQAPSTSPKAAAKGAATRRPTVTKAVRNGSGRRSRHSAGDVRAWARANGYTVRDRGRIPAEVVAAYGKSRP